MPNRFFLAVVLFACALVPSPRGAQMTQHETECAAMSLTVGDAINKQQWDTVAALERRYLSLCEDIMDTKTTAITLSILSESLTQLGLSKLFSDAQAARSSFEDALPIAQHCAAVKPDGAYCYLEMGRALMGLHRYQEEAEALRKAIAVGGYDEENAAAVNWAKEMLTTVEAIIVENAAAKQDNRSPADTRPIESFGSGFFIDPDFILTNEHAIHECKSIFTTALTASIFAKMSTTPLHHNLHLVIADSGVSTQSRNVRFFAG